MYKSKSWILWLVLAVLTVLVLIPISNPDSQTSQYIKEKQETSSKKIDEAAKKVDKAAKDVSKDVKGKTTNEGSNTDKNISQKQETPNYSIALEVNDVILNEGGCKVTVTGYDPNDFWGYRVNLLLENDTSKTVMFSSENESVNGFMTSAFWLEEVAPGKKCNTSMLFMSLEDDGITNVEDIEFKLYGYDTSTYSRLFEKDCYLFP